MNNKAKTESLKQFLTTSFLAGLSVLIPLYLTFYILTAIIRSFDQVVVNLPKGMRFDIFYFPGSGIVFAFILATAVGVLVRNYFGKILLKYFNFMMQRIPLVSPLYGVLREVAETIFGEGRGKSFRQVVLVQWPSKGIWSVGFVTADTTGIIEQTLKSKLPDSGFYNVFIPTTPNPTSGFYFIVPRSEVLLLSISVDQAFKNIVSGGTLSPDHFTDMKTD